MDFCIVFKFEQKCISNSRRISAACSYGLLAYNSHRRHTSGDNYAYESEWARNIVRMQSTGPSEIAGQDWVGNEADSDFQNQMSMVCKFMVERIGAVTSRMATAFGQQEQG